MAHHDDPAHGLTPSIEFRHTATHPGSEFHRAHMLDLNRHTAHRFQRDFLNFLERMDIPAAAHIKLRRPNLQDFPGGIAIGHAEFLDDFRHRNAVS